MKKYLSLIKFSHTVFALPFALIGFFIGTRETGTGMNWRLFILVVCAMVFARSAAMAFNRYIDRDYDKANPRTKSREIPAGLIRPGSALFFVILNCALFMTSALLINSICFYLSPLALSIILGYSYTKRFTALCHVFLGIGLSLAPIGAFLAVTGHFAVLPLLFSFSVLFWVAGFDIIYALQDQEFDKSLGLKSMPAFLGKSGALTLSSVLHSITFLLLIAAGYRASFGILYWCGFVIFSALLAYQHTLVKPDNLEKVNQAFATTNGIASVLFSCFVIAELWT